MDFRLRNKAFVSHAIHSRFAAYICFKMTMRAEFGMGSDRAVCNSVGVSPYLRLRYFLVLESRKASRRELATTHCRVIRHGTGKRRERLLYDDGRTPYLAVFSFTVPFVVRCVLFRFGGEAFS